jgi:programmed cell death protein 5
MNKILTKKALERMGRVKLVKPELATQLELYLMQIYQSGQIKKVIDDEQLKKILNSITSKKRYNLKR